MRLHQSFPLASKVRAPRRWAAKTRIIFLIRHHRKAVTELSAHRPLAGFGVNWKRNSQKQVVRDGWQWLWMWTLPARKASVFMITSSTVFWAPSRSIPVFPSTLPLASDIWLAMHELIASVIRPFDHCACQSDCQLVVPLELDSAEQRALSLSVYH